MKRPPLPLLRKEGSQEHPEGGELRASWKVSETYLLLPCPKETGCGCYSSPF